MAELPAYPPDAAICRLLTGRPLPTAAIADRLGMPERTVRHRLRQLRQTGVLATGSDGLHRLAAPAGPDLAASVAGDSPESGMPSGKVGGRRTVIAVLAVVGFGLAAVAVARAIRPDPPPKPPSPYGYAAGWYPGPAW